MADNSANKTGGSTQAGGSSQKTGGAGSASTATPKAAKAPKEKAPPKPKQPRTKMISKFPYSSKIFLNNDKDGKKYGNENNPKRGTAATRFNLYKDGMTLDQAVAAGIKPADIAWDSKKGWIRLEAPPADVKTAA